MRQFLTSLAWWVGWGVVPALLYLHFEFRDSEGATWASVAGRGELIIVSLIAVAAMTGTLLALLFDSSKRTAGALFLVVILFLFSLYTANEARRVREATRVTLSSRDTSTIEGDGQLADSYWLAGVALVLIAASTGVARSYGVHLGPRLTEG